MAIKYSVVLTRKKSGKNIIMLSAMTPSKFTSEKVSYYPFGLTHKGYNDNHLIFWESPGAGIQLVPVTPDLTDTYKYKYQEQERQDELGLNWDSFKWRNYDYAIGRFMSIDPLAEKYVYNSTYAFQENKMGLGRELEGLELYSERSKDGKSVTLIKKVKPVNNSNILTNDQFKTLVNARISQTQNALSGDAGDGFTITAKVVIDENATLIMEFNDALNTGDIVGEVLGLGHTDENGNTQQNRTQVNVPFAFEFDEYGQLIFSEESIQNITNTGTHEDGHQAGLGHVPDAKNSTNAMQETNSGYTFTPEQRAQILKKVEEEQPKKREK